MKKGNLESGHFVVVSSPLMHDLAEAIVNHPELKALHIPHYSLKYVTFANGEILPIIPETIRLQHVFFLHAFQHPDPNTAVMMMLLACDAMTRASAAGITLVAPYIPYLRQDRKDQPRVPISARVVADLVELAKVKQLITIDMHAEQEQGFFSIPVDNLTGVRVFADHIVNRFGAALENVVAVAPDFGGGVRTRRLAKFIGDIPVAIFEKRRLAPNTPEIGYIIGDPVAGKRVIIYEDMLDTGRTICGVAKALYEMGAREVAVYATHGIFSGNSERIFEKGEVSIVTTDSIPRPPEFYANAPWISCISAASYFAEAIHEAMQEGGSISKLALKRTKKEDR